MRGMADRPLKARFVDGLWWAPLGAFSASIFFMSNRESPIRIPDGYFEFDKVLHFGVYVVWALLCAVPVLRFWPSLRPFRLILIVGIAGLLYGISDEIHQAYVPKRQADVADLVADAVGAFTGAAVAAVTWSWWRRGRAAVEDKAVGRPRVLPGEK